MLPGPPTIYQTILNHPDLDALRHERRCAWRSPARRRSRSSWSSRCATRLGFETIVTGYGLTEVYGIATMCRHDDDPETIATTSGRAIPDVEVLVVDDDGNEVPRGEPGEIVVRGYNVMQRLLRRPRADRRDHRRRRLAAHRRHRDDGRARLHQDHRPQEGHVHRRRLQRLPGRDREPAARPTPTSPRSRWSACPTSAWARWAWPSSCPRPAARSTRRGRDRRLGPRAHGQLQGPAGTSRSSTPCPSTPAARCSRSSCGTGPRPSAGDLVRIRLIG